MNTGGVIRCKTIDIGRLETMKTLQALNLTKSEADRLVRRVRNSSVLRTYGVTVKLEPGDRMLVGSEMVDGVSVVVEAETDVQAGIGKGFLIAVSEGIESV